MEVLRGMSGEWHSKRYRRKGPCLRSTSTLSLMNLLEQLFQNSKQSVDLCLNTLYRPSCASQNKSSFDPWKTALCLSWYINAYNQYHPICTPGLLMLRENCIKTRSLLLHKNTYQTPNSWKVPPERESIHLHLILPLISNISFIMLWDLLLIVYSCVFL